MKKTKVLITISMLFLLLNINIISYGENNIFEEPEICKCENLNKPEKSANTISPMYVVYCPSPESPDGKHHYERIARNSSLKLKDSSGNVVGTWWGIPSECKYCGNQIWVDFYTNEYIHVSNIHREGVLGLWAYESDISPVHDDSMKF